jgi:DNA-binding NarL/FixJ family response regulator
MQEIVQLVGETHEIVGPAADLHFVAEVTTIDEAIRVVREDAPDVVLVDTDGPVGELVGSLQQLKRECPTTAVIVLGHGHGDEELFRAIEAGAAAHVPDSVRPPELLRTIRAVAAGEYVIDSSVAARPEVARRVLEAFRSAALGRQLDGDGPAKPVAEPLSLREAQILTLISEGQANKDIAAALGISQHTVKNHIKAVLRKLAVNNRTQAVLLALRQNWITREGPTQRPN